MVQCSWLKERKITVMNKLARKANTNMYTNITKENKHKFLFDLLRAAVRAPERHLSDKGLKITTMNKDHFQ